MANDKTYDRHVNIWINGKEVKNDISTIKKEIFNLTNEVAKTTRGTKEYKEKVAELRKVKGILKEHQDSISATGSSWSKLKGLFSSAQGILMAGIGAAVGLYQTFKGVIESTDASSDKFAKTMGGVKEAISEVSRAMANSSFKDFFKNVRAAVAEGQRFAEEQDAIGDSARALTLEEDRVASKILELKLIQNDARKSEEDRIKAGEDIERVMQEMADKRVAQAKKELDNQMENARFRTKLDDETIMGLLNQDAAFEQVFTTGKKYYDLVKEAESASGSRLREINKEVESASKSDKIFYELYKRFANLTDAEKDKIVADTKAVGDADRSAKDSIMRAITKLNAARANEAEEAEKAAQREIKASKEKKDTEGDTSGLEGVIATAIENPSYDADKYIIEEGEKRLDAEKAINAESLKGYEDTQNAKTEALIKAGETGKQEAIKNWNEIKEIDRENLEDMVAYYIAFGSKIGEALGQLIADGTLTAKEAAKQIVLIALDELSKLAEVKIAEATIRSIATYGPLLGTLRGVAQITLIKAAIEGAKGVISKNLWEGGYTGDGGKYQPAGIVHKGEYVINADTVANPAFRPMLESLEYNRVNGNSGYANGGNVASGPSGFGVAGSTPSSLGSDPEMKELLRKSNMLFQVVIDEGVTTRFNYITVDNIRKGITKLDDIEGKVSK